MSTFRKLIPLLRYGSGIFPREMVVLAWGQVLIFQFQMETKTIQRVNTGLDLMSSIQFTFKELSFGEETFRNRDSKFAIQVIVESSICGCTLIPNGLNFLVGRL